MPATQTQPTPELIFETLNAYQRTAALKAAIELGLFTGIGEGASTVAALAKRCGAAERGTRILCDYMVILGFLSKQEDRYALTPDSAAFLDARSPKCIAACMQFLLVPDIVDGFKRFTEAVRQGGSVMAGEATVEADNPLWVEFARSMAPLQSLPAEGLARMLEAEKGEKWKVLDVAAGHGLFGVAIARHNPNAEIYALDWAKVLDVAAENAGAAGVASRHHAIPGSAFDVNMGSGYDLILLTNFLHHYDPPAIENLLRKVHAALAPGGRAITLDFIPNEDRVSPRLPASFSVIMLNNTKGGEAYPFSDYQRMFRNAGFSSSELRDMPAGPSRVIISRK